MDIQNSLDLQVFKDDLDFKTLENILECLDNVVPKKISRQEFDNLNGNFLIETGEDKFGKHYDLFLPDDLDYGQLLFFIDFLSKKFGIENYTPYGRILTQTKVMVGVVLRGLGEEKGEEELRSLARKYNISDEFVDRILGEKLKYSEAKEIIGNIQAGRKEKVRQKVGEKKEDIELGFQELKDLFGNEFYLTFFRDGVNMLRLGMMTITQADQEGRVRHYEENGFDKEVLEDGNINFQKGDSQFNTHINSDNLEVQELKLREKIGIDNLKTKLNKARQSGDINVINEVELEATNEVIKAINTYFYEFIKNTTNGVSPNSIIRNKGLICAGYSLVGHTFLSELGIRHSGILIVNSAEHLSVEHHSALQVEIGERTYYFDGTKLNQVLEFTYEGENSIYKEIKLLEGKFKIPQFGILVRENEDYFLSMIYNSMVHSLYGRGKYKEAIKLINKAINLIPYGLFHLNKGHSLFRLGEFENSIEAYENAFNLAIDFEKQKILRIIFDNGQKLKTLGKDSESIIFFDLAIKLGMGYEAYNGKAMALYCIDKIEESNNLINLSIKLNPYNFGAYSIKRRIFREMGNDFLSGIYYYTLELLMMFEFEKPCYYIPGNIQQLQIQKLINSKNFEGLRLYLLEIEKEYK